MKKWGLFGASVAAICLANSVMASPYIGANLGYTTTNFQTENTIFTSNLAGNSFDAGLFAGYEHRFDNFYLAGEVNATGYNISTTNVSELGTLTYKLNSTYGIDILPGFFIAKNVKLFVLGGYQAGNFRFTNHFFGNYYSASKSLGAWDAGLGTDILLNDNFSLRLYYKYTDFSSVTFNKPLWNEKFSPVTNQFNLAIIYRFNFS